MNEEPNQECDSSIGSIEVSKRAVDDQVTTEVLKAVVDEAIHVVGAKAGCIRLLQSGKWSTAAATPSTSGYLEEIAKFVSAPSSEARKTMAVKAMVTKKPVVVDDFTSASLILLETRRIAAVHGVYGAL